MTSDIHLLKALSNQAHYKKYRSLIPNESIEETTGKILEWYSKWFEQYDDDVDFPSLWEFVIHVLGAKINKDKQNIYKLIIENLEGFEDDRMVTDIIQAYEETAKITQAIELLHKKIDGEDVEPHDYLSLLNTSDKISNDELLDKGLDKLLADDSGQVQFSLPCLKTIGKFDLDIMVSVAAVPDGGKTSLSLQLALDIIGQVGGNLLIVNNEESGRRIVTRALTIGLDTGVGSIKEAYSLKGGAEYILKRFKEETNIDYDKQVHLFESANTVQAIESKIDELKPNVIIYNNLDKVQGIEGDDWKRIQKLHQWAREIGKKNKSMAICIGQGAITLENKKYMAMRDLAEAKTSKAGEADIIIGLGSIETDSSVEIEGKWYQLRYLHTPKQKISGDKVKATLLLDVKTGRFIEHSERI